MGNQAGKPIRTVYEAKRGTHEAGSEITDPKDFFEDIINNQFNDVKALFDAADPDTQSQVADIFGENIFANQSAATMWFDENSEEPDDLQRAKDAIMPFLTQ